jgi:hypothetical protein
MNGLYYECKNSRRKRKESVMANIENQNRTVEAALETEKRGWASFIVMVFLLFFLPILYVCGLILGIASLSGVIKPINNLPTISGVCIGSVIMLEFVFSAMCVCFIKRIFIVEIGELVAKYTVVVFIGFAFIGFISEAVYGLILESWLGTSIFFIPVSLFYYLMVRHRVKSLKGRGKNNMKTYRQEKCATNL